MAPYLIMNDNISTFFASHIMVMLCLIPVGRRELYYLLVFYSQIFMSNGHYNMFTCVVIVSFGGLEHSSPFVGRQEGKRNMFYCTSNDDSNDSFHIVSSHILCHLCNIHYNDCFTFDLFSYHFESNSIAIL